MIYMIVTAPRTVSCGHVTITTATYMIVTHTGVEIKYRLSVYMCACPRKKTKKTIGQKLI